MVRYFFFLFSIFLASQAFCDVCHIKYVDGIFERGYRIYKVHRKGCGFECRYDEEEILRKNISENELKETMKNLSYTCTSFIRD